MKKKKKPEPNYRDFKSNPNPVMLTEREKKLKAELKEYRKNRKKAWYL